MRCGSTNEHRIWLWKFSHSFNRTKETYENFSFPVINLRVSLGISGREIHQIAGQQVEQKMVGQLEPVALLTVPGSEQLQPENIYHIIYTLIYEICTIA